MKKEKREVNKFLGKDLKKEVPKICIVEEVLLDLSSTQNILSDKVNILCEKLVPILRPEIKNIIDAEHKEYSVPLADKLSFANEKDSVLIDIICELINRVEV